MKPLTIFFNPKLNKICKVKSAKEKLPIPRIELLETYSLSLEKIQKIIEKNQREKGFNENRSKSLKIIKNFIKNNN